MGSNESVCVYIYAYMQTAPFILVTWNTFEFVK
jgi:hypothetical protein